MTIGEKFKINFTSLGIIAGVYVLFFILYHVFVLPFGIQSWSTPHKIPVTIPSMAAESCHLSIQSPKKILPRSTWTSRLATPFVLRVYCPGVRETNATATIIVETPDQILIQNQDGQPVSGRFDIPVASTQEVAQPAVFWLTYQPENFHSLIENTIVSVRFKVPGISNGPDALTAKELVVQRGPDLIDFINVTLDLIFGQTLFGIAMAFIGIFSFYQGQREKRKAEIEQEQEKINGIKNWEALYKYYKKNRALISQSPEVKQALRDVIERLQGFPNWNIRLSRAFLRDYDEHKQEALEIFEGIARFLPDGKQIVKSMKSLLGGCEENTIPALYFLGIQNIDIYWRLLQKHALLNKLKSQGRDQDKDAYRYSLVRYILLHQADTKGKKDIRKNFSPSLLEELDFWHDEAPAYSPAATPHPFQPLKAEADPFLRSHSLFWEAWPVWKVINEDAQTHWFTGAGGSGISASLRMGQYHHRPWGIHRFGFSLYVRWQGVSSETQWKMALQAALYRSLQRALAEDPVWFLRAPRTTRLVIQCFMDSLSLCQDGWQPPRPDATADAHTKDAQAKDVQLLREAFAYLRSLSGKDEPSPPVYEVLQQSFAALYAYHRDSASHHDEKPWVWIELPPDAAPDSHCLAKKIRFLKANEDLWSYCTPKIFLPLLPDDVHLPESISLQWDEKQLAALLEHRMRQSNWAANKDFWETTLCKKLKKENDPLDLKNTLPWQNSADAIMDAFCRRAAQGCQTPRAVFEQLSPYASLFQKGTPEG